MENLAESEKGSKTSSSFGIHHYTLQVYQGRPHTNLYSSSAICSPFITSRNEKSYSQYTGRRMDKNTGALEF